MPDSELELKEMAKAWTETLLPTIGISIKAKCFCEASYFYDGRVYRAKLVISSDNEYYSASWQDDPLFWSKYCLSEKDAWKDLLEHYSARPMPLHVIWMGKDLSWAFPVCSSAAELRILLAAVSGSR